MKSCSVQQETQPARVVVIDDSRSILAFVVELLGDAGYDAEGAADGITGLGLVDANEPDVILLDVEMPGMNGLQVLDRLAEKRHLFAIIMCTTHSEIELIVDAFARGADDYIVKPFNENELLARVAAAKRTVALKKSLSDAHCRSEKALIMLRETQARLVEEKKLHAVSRLAAGVAHEINNPLGYIQSNFKMLCRYAEFFLASTELSLMTKESGGGEVLGISAPVMVDYKKLEKIKSDFYPLIQETQQGIDRITAIVKCFRNLEQGITGSREVREEDLNSIIKALLDIIRPSLPQEVMLSQSLSPGLLPVIGTLGMLNIVFENLLLNSMDAVGGCGEIIVITGRNNATVYCDICDSGPGISDEIRQNIFEPFFTTKSDSHHFGLGLTIAKSFIAAHGGLIEIVPSRDKGNGLRVSLPVAGHE